MSTAYFPLGMRSSMPASGYNHKSTIYNKQYVTWKGSGINSNPVGSAPGHIRPLTNNDPGNVFLTGFGLARPIKHFRKGRVIPSQPIPENNEDYSPEKNYEIQLINYNLNRFVSSSKGTSLGGGFGGSGLLNEIQDKPGSYIVKLNTPDEINETMQSDKNCKTCESVSIVTNYYPNKPFLEENPEPNTQNSTWCCNDERKAKRRAIYASTNLSKKYYTTSKQYLQNRCKTYDQKAFNFYSSGNINAKPGDPNSLSNTYVGNCYPSTAMIDGPSTNSNWCSKLTETQAPTNPSGCKLAVYKPSNYQFAVQGGVTSSTRTLKLSVTTIQKNVADIKNQNFLKMKGNNCNPMCKSKY
jgi:hypothetical protein